VGLRRAATSAPYAAESVLVSGGYPGTDPGQAPEGTRPAGETHGNHPPPRSSTEGLVPPEENCPRRGGKVPSLGQPSASRRIPEGMDRSAFAHVLANCFRKRGYAEPALEQGFPPFPRRDRTPTVRKSRQSTNSPLTRRIHSLLRLSLVQ